MKRCRWAVILVLSLMLGGLVQDATPVDGLARASVAGNGAPVGPLHVATGGADQVGCGTTSLPCRTVQYAIDQAADGATLKVAGGTYDDVQQWVGPSYTTTQVLHVGKSITVSGGYTLSDWSTANPARYPTILDAGGQGQVIVVGNAPTVTLEGLHIVNGYTTGNGGGVGDREQTDRLTIRDCQILNNVSEDNGGGIYVNGGALVVERSRVVSNTAASDGGGVYARDGIVTMTHTLFQFNVADSGDGRGTGAGAWLYETVAYLADNTFEGNLSGDAGGGLYVGWGDLILHRNTFSNNAAGDYGGGLYAGLDTGHAYTITHNLFQGNVGNRSGSGSGGGARLFGAEGGQLTFRHNRVLDNVAASGPTGANGGRGGGLFVLGPAVIADNLFQGNWGSSAPPQNGYHYGGYGGGLYLMGPGLRVERNRILDNYAARDAGINYTAEAFGGGVRVAPTLNTVVTMTNNIIAGNHHCADCTSLQGSYRGGGAIAVGGYTSPVYTKLYLYHNTIADNQSPALFNESAAITMSHSILSGHDVDLRTILDSSGAADSLPPTTAADYTLWWPAMTTDIVSGTWTHSHDLTGAPDFVSTALDDYHLGSGSRAIDAGPGAGVTEDLDEHARPLLSGYDLGADEYTGVDLVSSTKRASPERAAAGEVITFAISLHNGGTADAPGVVLYDPIPADTVYVSGSAYATSGAVTDGDGIGWTGTITAGTSVTVTFRVMVSDAVAIQNTAVVTDPHGLVYPLTAGVNGEQIYLPLVLRAYR